MVRDLSTTGAAIEFPERVELIPIAKAFTLVIPDDRLRLPCRIVCSPAPSALLAARSVGRTVKINC
jgi:hypothetical protein